MARSRPNFDLSDLNSDAYNKCRDFLPQLKESNEKLDSAANIAMDSDISLCPNEELGTAPGEANKITLDVGVGAFDVENDVLADDELKSKGITVCNMPSNSMIFTTKDDLISEIDPK